MVLPAGAGRFRQRKISVKQTLHVLRQRDMPDLDREEQQRELQHVETGVEKGEEEERDLQRVMQATTAKFREGKKNVREASIPTPDASRVWTTKEKLFGDRTYDFTEEYLKFSATVEETSGCPYSIDEEDETFLEELNSKDPSKKLSVDEFEHMMYRLECVEDEKQPFLSMDPKQILGYEEIRQLVEIPPPEGSNERLMQDLGKKLGVGKLETLYDRKAPGQDIRPLHQLMELFGEPVYGHWRKRRLARGGKCIIPKLRFEDPAQQQRDDEDPYVCFRRREYRHARKTRRADLHGILKLRLLDADFRRLANLLQSVATREQTRTKEIDAAHQVFTERCEVKQLKRQLGIQGEDQDLVDKRRASHIRREQERLREKEKERQRMKARRDREYQRQRARHEKERLRREKKAARDYRRQQQRREKELQQQRRLQQRQSSGHTGTHRRRAVLVDEGPESLAAQIRRQTRQQQAANAAAAEQMAAQRAAMPAPVQPYVKLPSARIPDLDMTTVDEVLHEKMQAVKKAVSDRLVRRKLQDEGWINYTDDAYNPYFDLVEHAPQNNDQSHAPFSSLASADAFEPEDSRLIDFSYLFDNSRHYSNSDDDIIRLSATTGQPVRADRHTSLPVFYDALGSGYNGEINSKHHHHHNHVGSGRGSGRGNNSSADSSNESDYGTVEDGTRKLPVSEVLAKIRLRLGPHGRKWLDRKYVKDDLGWKRYVEDDETDEGTGDSSTERTSFRSLKRKRPMNAYDSRGAAKRRLRSRYLFDNDLPYRERLDPARLNGIDPQTQQIRFGSMLLSKSYEGMRKIRQRQIQAYQQHFMRQQKLIRQRFLQQRQNLQKQKQKQFQKQQQRRRKQQKQQRKQQKRPKSASLKPSKEGSGDVTSLTASVN